MRLLAEAAATPPAEPVRSVAWPYVQWVLREGGLNTWQPAVAAEAADLMIEALASARALVGRVPGVEPAALAPIEFALAVDFKRLHRMEAALDLIECSGLGDAQSLPELVVQLLLEAADGRRRLLQWDRCRGHLNVALGLLEHGLLAPERAQALRAEACIGMAALEFDMGRGDLADPWLREAREIARAGGFVLQQALALFMALRVEHAASRDERALSAWDEFVAQGGPGRLDCVGPIGESLHYQLQIRAALCALSVDMVSDGRDARVVPWLEEAIGTPDLSADERILAWQLLAMRRIDAREFARAELALGQADALLTAARGGLSDERSLMSAGLWALASLERGDDREALERDTARLEGHLRAFLARWEADPASRVGIGPLAFEDRRDAIATLMRARISLLGAADGALAALCDLVQAQAVGSLGRSLGATAPGVTELVAELCGARRGLLCIVPGRSRAIAVALDQGGPACFELDVSGARIELLRRRFLNALLEARDRGDPADAALAQARRELATALFPPALRERIAAWRALAVVGSEALGYLPFEALPDERGALLGTRFALSYLPSLPVALWLARNRPMESGRAETIEPRVLACPAPDVGFPIGTPAPVQLPFGPRERERLLGGRAPRATHWLAGDLASLDAKTVSPKPSGDLLVVLAHGVTDESRPDPQGLLLAGGKVLWSENLERASLPPYVELASCNAGRGRQRRGDDGRNLLSGSAIVAGARAVLLPRVDVGYEPALEFLERLNAQLLEHGTSLEEAARTARAETHPDNLDALFFHVVGLGDLPLVQIDSNSTDARRPAAKTKSAAALLGAAALAISVLWILRRRAVRAPG